MGARIGIVGGQSNESSGQNILPGQAIIVFATAFPPTPMEVGHLLFNLTSTAFEAVVSSRSRESVAVSVPGFTVGFLEKQVQEWWSRFVLCVH